MTDKPPESNASDPTLGLPERNEFLLYTAADGAIHIRVALRNGNLDDAEAQVLRARLP